MKSDIKPDFEKLALNFTLKYLPKESCVTDTDVIIQSTLCTGYYNGAKDMYETLEKKVIRLAKALKVAQQMIIGYDMRHPNEKQILNGFTNTEVKELIENSYEIEHEDPLISTVKRLQEENE